MFVSRIQITAAVLAVLPSVAPAEEAPVDLVVSTLEWPPYTGSHLPGEGAASEVLRAAIAAETPEAEVEIRFLPWNRAVALARDSEAVHAYFPGYDCTHEEGFVSSAPFGASVLGFAEPRPHPLNWRVLEDLSGLPLKFGTVLGYRNTKAFDDMVAQGALQVLSAKDDVTNLRRLLAGRVDAVVIDQRVMRYLVRTEPSLWAQKIRIGFNAKPLAEQPLHVCFKDDAKGRELRDRFDRGLASLDQKGAMIDAYIQREFQ
ncbi:Bacterial extracellular solute-binding proteins, family 3 [Tritonibacter multivorans]|uniref:Bacterial extracellular solute-binding proteins, family 3 n=1 Tax=Tritonibacter multivorans TaxID=928856 RepID=A0A0P1G7T2_9RHOB|nr:transporter substrate-binding domain-containing protein [Tritonibacter multivorans]MDA7421173.1 transporter substrate-binding domain-containing protein [Tritonibacter multivorans]CUH77579.1 Bacterial extracellular solute-binding proteins, family 3 [Tritonibacter multivorans]SFD33945.1 polar amino acid transport system substrate-binding protein [Tritonibacter multivorans]